MAKCSGCKKIVDDKYFTYHRSKCSKAKNLLQRSLQIFHRRRKEPEEMPGVPIAEITGHRQPVEQETVLSQPDNDLNNEVSS